MCESCKHYEGLDVLKCKVNICDSMAIRRDRTQVLWISTLINEPRLLQARDKLLKK